MNKVVEKHFFSDNVAGLVVEAPLIARNRRAGHFVIVRVDEHSERMPLTIADADIEKGTITLVVQRVGVSSAKLTALNVGDEVADIAGPLGRATDIQKLRHGRMCLWWRGCGTDAAYRTSTEESGQPCHHRSRCSYGGVTAATRTVSSHIR